VEFGDSRTHALHFMLSLQAMGPPDLSVGADTPLHAVFKRSDGGRTYLAYNAGSRPATVRFTDGQVLEARGPLRVVSLGTVSRSPVHLLITNEGLAPSLLTLSLRADPVTPAASRPAPPASDPLLPPGSAPAGSAQGLN